MRPRGLTLIETLVSLALLALLFSVTYQVLLPGWRLWAFNQQQASLEECGLVIETAFLRDVQHSTVGSFAAQAPPAGTDPASVLQAVSFATTGTEDGPDSFDPTSGLPLWQSYVIYFVPAQTHTLYRKFWPVPWLPLSAQTPTGGPSGQLPYTFPSSAPTPLAPTDLSKLCQIANGTETVLGTAVQSFGATVVQGSSTSGSNGQLFLDLSAPSVRGTATAQRTRQFHCWM